MRKEFERYRIQPGSKVKPSDFDPNDTRGAESKQASEEELPRIVGRLAELQNRLYAEAERSVLVILQALDAGGKDGTIRHIFSGVNPQGCSVTSFKPPSKDELAHDFLWRVHRAAPAKGMIGIFNRSHYEDVLIVRVHNLVPKSVWKKRFDQINHFEELLYENKTTILKFFLLIDREEQKQRLEDRIREPSKHWKVNPDDLVERSHWDEYMEAYEDVLQRCTTEYAPWYVIPANKKWYRNLVISSVVVDAMEKMDIQDPKPPFDVSKLVVE